jgi:prolyl oligopeptidase
MRKGLTAVALLALALAACSPAKAPESAALPGGLKDLTPESVKAADENLWLEEVNGEKPLAWVKEQNDKTMAVFSADPRYEQFRREAFTLLTAEDRTPVPRFRARGIDNFWQDKTNVRGVWRKTSLASYRTKAPKWETVLDIDALAKKENANWIWKGANCLDPEETLCLVSLSDGGKDAVVVREFDVGKKAFVDNGFKLPEGKHSISWLDNDTLLIATDFGQGTLTESGYPYIVKSIKRGQTLDQATEVYKGAQGDGGYGVDPYVLRDDKGGVVAVLVNRPLDTFRAEVWEIVGGKPVKLNLPERLSIYGAMGGSMPKLVFRADEQWKFGGRDVSAGALLAVGFTNLRPAPVDAKVVDGVDNADWTVFEPTKRQSIEDVAVFDRKVVATIYDNVKARVSVFGDGGEFGWKEDKPPVPDNVAISLGSTSREQRQLFLSMQGFLLPSTLSLANIDSLKAETIKQSPERFDGSKHVVEQFEAKSADGTMIPYFVVRPKDAPMDGTTPTIMFGYGGFQISETPSYRPEVGKLWLEKGGAYVLTNIRGGGEFGPAWHQAALKGNRQKAFDYFAAIAADLAARKITSAKHLGIYGRSNGGVLTSVMLTQHPELIGGAVIESPLVDMLRYHELPPGASWMGEYGDPRIPEEAAFIAKYSGYQNAKKGAAYPEVYITTNTHDDRVHPGHARKFAARLQAQDHPALYYEETNGGHSNDSDPILNSQRWARHYVYLARALGLPAG